MRILLTADPMIPVPPTGYGGIERIVDTLVGELRQRGHVVGLIAKHGSHCETDAFFSWPGNNVGGRLDTVRNVLALRQAVRAFQPDLVHSFSRLAYLSAVLPLRLPKIMSYQRHVSRATTRGALRLARANTLRFTGCSEFICRQGRASGGDWKAIHNFVDLAKIDFVPEVGENAPLLFLSRLDPIKGPDIAIRIAQLASRPILVAGNQPTGGPDRVFFDEKIAPLLNKPGVEWIGEVGDAQKNDLLGRCAALVVPIRWDEPFGIVFAEALAAGTPVITCSRGALPEIVRPGTTGWFIEDAESGAAAVARLNELDRRACRQDAEARFCVDVCVSRYLAAYEEAIAASRS